MNTSYVYLLHFSQPIAPGRHTAQHYLGSCEDLDERIRTHRTDPDARLLQVAAERGIDFEVVRIWRADPGQGRALERKLKNRKMSNRLCPICASERKRRQWQGYLPGLSPLWDGLHFDLGDLPELEF
jgi:ribosomal protein L32